MASRSAKLHGRIEGAAAHCAVPGCREPGEFRAPLTPGDFDGPGAYRWMCLDHVREHNAAYNYFNGMSPDEIAEAQSPYFGWGRSTRAFSTAGADPAPAWSDFSDPLDAIAARYRPGWTRGRVDRFSAANSFMLWVISAPDVPTAPRFGSAIPALVRKFHPDRNGDRGFEKQLGEVIANAAPEGARPSLGASGAPKGKKPGRLISCPRDLRMRGNSAIGRRRGRGANPSTNRRKTATVQAAIRKRECIARGHGLRDHTEQSQASATVQPVPTP